MADTGLRHYLQHKKAAMDAAAAEHPDPSHWREAVEAVCVADDESGVRKLRLRDWEFIGDSGPAFGGQNLGPSSPELLCGVISTCLTHTYLIGAAHLGVPVDRVEVRATADNNDAPLLGIAGSDPLLPFNIRATVTLVAPDATDAQLGRLHRYAEQCPITNLIRNSNPVTVITG
ncbi:MAG: OsmC family protein [Dehalococcoidia bacterium]|nr:OsmC family protein [Dehalococcoidia bacterium]